MSTVAIVCYAMSMARQTTLNVSLTPPLRDFVDAKVRAGGYAAAPEVVRDGLRALQERERAAAAFWAEVKAKVAVARREVAEGKTVDGEAAMDSLIAELDGTARPPARGKATRKRSR